jgi:serine/threonine protein kinase
MLRDKDCLSPVIVDFGLAVYQDDEDYIYYNCGTPGYLSPESLKMKKN